MWPVATYAAALGPAPHVLVILALLELLVIGGLAYYALVRRARCRRTEAQLLMTKEELRERSAALADAEGEVERLRQIPKAELLPMLKLAHQQRSPLAAIQNALDMLLQGYARNDQQLQEEMLSMARDRAATMLARVNDFLRLGAVRHAEIERKVQPVQLLDVLQRLAPEKQVRAKWKAVDLQLNLPESLPVVTGSPEDMEHLLSNLINNAIKYTDPGGRVTISLREDDGSVVGAVEDTGVGISPQDLPRIFDEFYRAESAKDMANGTGLGLAIVKRVVDLYGGRLDVESELGKGSKFTFRFPKDARVKEQEELKTFRDLETEVIGRGICSRCAGCVTFCSAGKLNALQIDQDGHPLYADEAKCLMCGICYLICPRTRDLDAELRRRFRWSLPIGAYQSITAARSTDAAIREKATDGGVLISLLLYMLENYLIQGALVPSKRVEVGQGSWIATNREELLTFAQPTGSCVYQEREREYTTFSTVVPAIGELKNGRMECVAMVAPPCQVGAIRKAQCLGVSPAHAVGYALGPFCTGQLSFGVSHYEKLEDKLHMDLTEVEGLSVQEDLGIFLRDGKVLRVPFTELDDLTRPACLTCAACTNDYADIAVGAVRSPDDYASILIRTEKGARVYNGALGQGYVEEREIRDSAQSRAEKTRMLAQVVALARRKRERAQVWLADLGIAEEPWDT